MNAHTKQQQDKVFETDFIDSQKSDPAFAHLLAIIIYYYIYISILVTFVEFQGHRGGESCILCERFL